MKTAPGLLGCVSLFFFSFNVSRRTPVLRIDPSVTEHCALDLDVDFYLTSSGTDFFRTAVATTVVATSAAFPLEFQNDSIPVFPT